MPSGANVWQLDALKSMASIDAMPSQRTGRGRGRRKKEMLPEGPTVSIVGLSHEAPGMMAGGALSGFRMQAEMASHGYWFIMIGKVCDD